MVFIMEAKAPEVDYTGKTTLTFIGHASVKIVAKDGSVLYIDPNYYAGDTSMIEQMKALKNRNIDYAMYPIDGVFNMDAVEATEVANLVGAKFNIPIHENDRNGTKKSDNFTPQGRLILEYGQTIILE